MTSALATWSMLVRDSRLQKSRPEGNHRGFSRLTQSATFSFGVMGVLYMGFFMENLPKEVGPTCSPMTFSSSSEKGTMTVPPDRFDILIIL